MSTIPVATIALDHSSLIEPEREVRFAVVIYGGVSLAIYINGIVQELLRMVRATALPPEKLKHSELVYRKLACHIGSRDTESLHRFCSVQWSVLSRIQPGPRFQVQP